MSAARRPGLPRISIGTLINLFLQRHESIGVLSGRGAQSAEETLHLRRLHVENQRDMERFGELRRSVSLAAEEANALWSGTALHVAGLEASGRTAALELARMASELKGAAQLVVQQEQLLGMHRAAETGRQRGCVIERAGGAELARRLQVVAAGLAGLAAWQWLLWRREHADAAATAANQQTQLLALVADVREVHASVALLAELKEAPLPPPVQPEVDNSRGLLYLGAGAAGGVLAWLLLRR